MEQINQYERFMLQTKEMTINDLLNQYETESVKTYIESVYGIPDAGTYLKLTDYYKLLKDLTNKIYDYFEPTKKSAHATWQGICRLEKEEIDKVKDIMTKCNLLICSYLEDQERIRKEKERKAFEELKAREESDRLAKAEHILNETSSQELALETLKTQDFIPSPTIPSQVPKVKGIYEVKTRYAVVVDFLVLVRAVASGEISREALLPNMVFLNGLAKTFTGSSCCPGVQFCEQTTIRYRK